MFLGVSHFLGSLIARLIATRLNGLHLEGKCRKWKGRSSLIETTRVTDLFRVVLSQDWRWRRRKSLPDIKVLSHSKFFDIGTDDVLE